MTQKLDNFIMLGTDAKGVDYKIVMTDEETSLYNDALKYDAMDLAYDAWEQACEREGVEFDSMPDMITAE